MERFIITGKALAGNRLGIVQQLAALESQLLQACHPLLGLEQVKLTMVQYQVTEALRLLVGNDRSLQRQHSLIKSWMDTYYTRGEVLGDWLGLRELKAWQDYLTHWLLSLKPNYAEQDRLFSTSALLFYLHQIELKDDG